jgi:hypothetical protein
MAIPHTEQTDCAEIGMVIKHTKQKVAIYKPSFLVILSLLRFVPVVLSIWRIELSALGYGL